MGRATGQYGLWKVPARWTDRAAHRALDIAERCPHLPQTRRLGVTPDDSIVGGSTVEHFPFPFPGGRRGENRETGKQRPTSSSTALFERDIRWSSGVLLTLFRGVVSHLCENMNPLIFRAQRLGGIFEGG